MSDLNFVVLTGQSTKDPVLRPKASGQAKAEFSFEVTRPFYRANGEAVSDLFLVDAWGDLGKWALDNVRQGTKLVIVGTLNKEIFTSRGNREHLMVIKAKKLRLLDGEKLESALDTELVKEDMWDDGLLSSQMQVIKEIVDL